ncbi:elongator complex protein 1, partial [Tremellales sp. Uapishka_1]
MRSLTPLEIHIASTATFSKGSQLGRIAVDPESGAVYATLERYANDAADVEVEVVKFDSKWKPEVISSFTSEGKAPHALPSFTGETVHLHYFPDDRSLVILMAGGDIATLILEGTDGDVAPIEVVGSVEGGIKAAGWSPDEEQLVLISGEDNLVCMTRTFDLVHEEPLRSEEFGEDKFINVGWGSKATQFHGTLGKAAAASTSASASSSLAHPSDVLLPKITFRGDAAYFAISYLEPVPSAHRQIRIYSRDPTAGFIPKLSATSESLPGLESEITWRPSGNLLSGLVRYGYPGGGEGREGRWEVAMIERNGLRHGGFELAEEKETWKAGRVRGMEWNSDSEVLAIWIERPDGDVIQLWSMKNYHYYLKQEIYSHSSKKSFRGFKWHPEHPLTIYVVGDDFVQMRTFVWDTYIARLDMPNDTASVAVIDGKKLLITPFRTQNTPPPMSSYSLALPTTPTHVCFSSSSDRLSILFPNGLVQLWELNTRLPDPKSGSRLRGGGKVAEPVLLWEGRIESQAIPKQIALGEEGEVTVLARSESACVLLKMKDGKVTKEMEIGVGMARVFWGGESGWLLADQRGAVYAAADAEAPLITLCPQPQAVSISHSSSLIFALSSTGKLLFTSLLSDNDPIPLASSVTSFVLTPDFLIYATSSQSSHYAPLPILRRMSEGEDIKMEWESRRVERGSLIVTACPSAMSLVLQMPRGNLETVYPRPLVLAVVRKDVLAGRYRDAFVSCRKHRLDLNILYDLAPERLMSRLQDFVNQIPEVDYLNLFVSALSEEDSSKTLYQDLSGPSDVDVSESKINTVCTALRALLEKKDLVKYVDTILTTHVCSSPPDYEAGLRVLLQLQVEHPTVVEDAIKYIIFLSDINKLYDVALGMYNFQLVLMVAQYSQKDPKEYLPFLRELRALDKFDQRFRIDDHLGRRASALRNLRQAGPERFEEAASYLARYELYEEAFNIYKGDQEHLPTIYGLYGDYLYDRRDFQDAAIAYTLASDAAKAMKAYEKAHAWRDLFTLALQQRIPQHALLEMCERVTDHLASRGRTLDASQVYLDYAKDVDSAVDVLCRGTEFSEAYRVATKYDREDLVESAIHTGLEDAQESLTEVFEEMEGQLKKEMSRLGELRRIRLEDPDSFYIVDTEPALEGVDVATNATTVATAFTRYTVAPTTAFSQTTKMTGQTARSLHKKSRKRAAGRKGTVDEYEYLLASIGRLILRVDEKSADAAALLRHLIISSSEHRDLAVDLQAIVINLRTELSESLEEAWKDREAVIRGAEESGGQGYGDEPQKAREVVKPVVGEWKGLGGLV